MSEGFNYFNVAVPPSKHTTLYLVLYLRLQFIIKSIFVNHFLPISSSKPISKASAILINVSIEGFGV